MTCTNESITTRPKKAKAVQFDFMLNFQMILKQIDDNTWR